MIESGRSKPLDAVCRHGPHVDGRGDDGGQCNMVTSDTVPNEEVDLRRRRCVEPHARASERSNDRRFGVVLEPVSQLPRGESAPQGFCIRSDACEIDHERRCWRATCRNGVAGLLLLGCWA